VAGGKRLFAVAVAVLLVGGAAGPAENPKDKRTPVPDAAAQDKAEKLIKGLLKEDYAKKKPAEMLALVTKLAKEAKDGFYVTAVNRVDGTVARFVLLREARDLAIQAGETAMVLQLVDQMVQEYALPAPTTKAAALEKLGPVVPPAGSKVFVDASLLVAKEALAADEFDSADRLLKVAGAVAQKAKNLPLVASVNARSEEAKGLRKEYDRVTQAVAVLKKDPKNPEACTAVGRYYSLMKGQWEEGLPLLADGKDEKLKELAKKDLATPSEAFAQMAVGDAWWDLAGADKFLAKANMQRRAYYWYQKALPQLGGFSKIKVEKRVDQIAASFPDLNLLPPMAEKFLHDGKFAEGETALLLALDANPRDDEVRFGLGAVQFLRAVDKLGQALYEYGAVSEKATQPFLRLPVPRNEKPSAISYKALGRVLDAFAVDIGRAEATLAGIKNDKVKLRLRLAKITFDFAGTGQNRTTLLELLIKLNGGRLKLQETNPDFRVHFDRGDVAWLRAYCHLLSAMVEGYRAVDEEAGFEERVKEIFPKVEAPGKKADPNWVSGLRVVDAPRLRRMRLHLVAVCELNRETWDYIRKETDDDFEWLPHPKQTDQLGLPLTDERIDAWLAMMKEWEGLLKGELLVPSELLQFGIAGHPKGQGLNLKKLLDDPPVDLLNSERIRKKGIDAKYLEAEEGKPKFNVSAVGAVIQLLDGPFGFAYAARLN
jgi:hypothetical protein